MSRFLREANSKGLPFGEAISDATPIGPLATYPGDDTWTARPFVPGVVLVGDAAGWNNPIIGQGLSISLRDVRMVRDAIRQDAWGAGAFEAGPSGTEGTQNDSGRCPTKPRVSSDGSDGT